MRKQLRGRPPYSNRTDDDGPGARRTNARLARGLTQNAAAALLHCQRRVLQNLEGPNAPMLGDLSTSKVGVLYDLMLGLIDLYDIFD